MPVPLSEGTTERVQALFRDDDSRAASRLLAEECGRNLPFCEDSDSRSLERLRFAALKLSRGSLEGLREAIELAKKDWRDLLVAADFANDVHAHERWQP